jgi:hypothetical protein
VRQKAQEKLEAEQQELIIENVKPKNNP